MSNRIRVSILDDHQSIIDGYIHRLSAEPDIIVIAAMSYAEELEPALAAHPTDVLLLDISVPTSPDNPNPYPILYTIPKLLDRYAGLSILVISMYVERQLIKSVMDTGAGGYVLKDDQTIIRNLAHAVRSIASGGVVFSEQAHRLLLRRDLEKDRAQLTQRQLEALSLSAAFPGWTTAELANKMSVTNSTIRSLLSNAYLHLGVHSRLAAITKACELGLITPSFPTSVAYQ